MSRGLLAPYSVNKEIYDKDYDDLTKFQNEPNFKSYETQLHKRGTRYPGQRRGLGSLMEGGSVKTDLLEKQAKYRTGLDNEEPGVYRIKLMKNDTQAAPHSTINIGGRLFKSDREGNMKIIDPEYVNMEMTAAKEAAEYSEKLLRACMTSDAMCLHLLGQKMFDKLASGEGGGADGFLGDRPDEALRLADGRPSRMLYMSSGSLAYSNSVTKLRLCVDASPSIILNEEDTQLQGGSVSIPRTVVDGTDRPTPKDVTTGVGGIPSV